MLLKEMLQRQREPSLAETSQALAALPSAARASEARRIEPSENGGAWSKSLVLSRWGGVGGGEGRGWGGAGAVG
jgi:hypothetical protein